MSSLYEGMKDQFVIALPQGWTVYDQTASPIQKPGPFDVVFFSSVDMARLQAEHRVDDFVKVSSGEIPAFFVDRSPAFAGTACATFPKKAQKQALRVFEDTLFKKGVKKLEPVTAEEIRVGGCQGIRFRGRALYPDGTDWTMEVRAVSDGLIGYMFVLRNETQYFGKNKEAYDSAMSSLRMSAAR